MKPTGGANGGDQVVQQRLQGDPKLGLGELPRCFDIGRGVDAGVLTPLTCQEAEHVDQPDELSVRVHVGEVQRALETSAAV